MTVSLYIKKSMKKNILTNSLVRLGNRKENNNEIFKLDLEQEAN